MGDKPPIDTQIAKSEPAPSEVQAPSALEQVAQNLSGLKPKTDTAISATVGAGAPGMVLPAIFYEGASNLVSTPEELELLRRFRNFDDEDVEILPTGEVYVEHIYYSEALTEVYGTAWALIPATPLYQAKDGVSLAREYILKIRGCFVGQAMGEAKFNPKNSRMDYGDVSETVRAQAFHRILAKSSLGIGSNPWKKSFQRRWKSEYAVQVHVLLEENNQKKNEKWWRRIDVSPEEAFGNNWKFVREIGPVVKEPTKQTGGKQQNEVDKQRSENAPQRSEDTGKQISGPEKSVGVDDRQHNGHEVLLPIGGGMQDKSVEDPPKVTPQPITSEPATAAAAQPQGVEMANEGNFRLFMMDARRRKLVDGDNALPAIAWICKTMNCAAPVPAKGETSLSVLRRTFFERTRQEFNDILLPKLREKG